MLTVSVISLFSGKRAQAKKAELDFMELLKSNASKIPITSNSQWKDVSILFPCPST